MIISSWVCKQTKIVLFLYRRLRFFLLFGFLLFTFRTFLCRIIGLLDKSKITNKLGPFDALYGGNDSALIAYIVNFRTAKRLEVSLKD